MLQNLHASTQRQERGIYISSFLYPITSGVRFGLSLGTRQITEGKSTIHVQTTLLTKKHRTRRYYIKLINNEF